MFNATEVVRKIREINLLINTNMLKICCVKDVFLGTWPKLTEHLFQETFYNFLKENYFKRTSILKENLTDVP